MELTEKQDRNKSRELTPISNQKIRTGATKKVAAGIPAVTSTFKHSIGKMGFYRTIKTLTTVNQKTGFDCPGCAWPDPDDHRTSFEFCENGAKAVADEAMKKRITQKFFQKWSVSELSEKSDYWLNKQGRLCEPMILENGSNNYQSISWDDAFELIGNSLRNLKNPNEAIFYTSGRTSNEAAFLYQLFVREFGTNNLPDCSNLCHESSGKGLGHAIGIGKGTVTLDDFSKSDLVIVMGQNPGTNHPRMLSALEITKQNGGKIIHINPLPETGLTKFKHPQDYLKFSFRSTSLADLFLPVKINGDVALLKGIMKECLENHRNCIDSEFIENYTDGFSELEESIRKSNWDDILLSSGISRAEIKDAAELYSNAKSVIICWAMGLTQHENGVGNVQEVANLLLLGGHIGRPGAGACPVRGHSNVQGDRTMGIWEHPPESFLQSLDKNTGMSSPRKPGLDAVNSIKAMYNGECRVFFAMGGNFLSATPDTQYTAKGIRNCDLTIQVSTKLNRSHLVTGRIALILPCLGRTEIDVQSDKKQFVSVENSMGVVHASEGNLKPASKYLLSEPKIVANLAKSALGERSVIDWDELVSNYDHIRDLIEQCIPGFDSYNERVRISGGFYLPNPPRDSRTFNTHTGKANFTLNKIPNNVIQEGKFMMMTIRSHDQYNTTIYGHDDRYRGIKGNRRVVLMNKQDMNNLGLGPKDTVTLRCDIGGVERLAEDFSTIPYEIPSGCIATYFPEANCLVPITSVAKKSNTPASKSIPVEILIS